MIGKSHRDFTFSAIGAAALAIAMLAGTVLAQEDVGGLHQVDKSSPVVAPAPNTTLEDDFSKRLPGVAPAGSGNATGVVATETATGVMPTDQFSLNLSNQSEIVQTSDAQTKQPRRRNRVKGKRRHKP